MWAPRIQRNKKKSRGRVEFELKYPVEKFKRNESGGTTFKSIVVLVGVLSRSGIRAFGGP